MHKLIKLNKHGASTVFIAIILSALILVECTYLTFVWDLDRRMEISRALKNEVQTILADYDRELYRTYGIYAFHIEDVDDVVFKKVMEAHGSADDEGISVDGYEILDRESLRKAISTYYAYRTAGIVFRTMFEQVSGVLDKIDEKGLIGKIRSFTSSGAAEYLSEILSDSDTINEKLERFSSEIDVDELQELIPGLQSIKDLVNDSNDDVTSSGISIRLSDLSFITEGYSLLESLIDDGSGFVSGRSDHLMLAHFAAYNFDCMIDNDSDCSITGVRFSDIHDGDYLDSEYMITGLDGRFGAISVSTLIFETLLCKNFLDQFSDPAKTMAYETAAILASTLIAVLSEGAIEIPNEMMKMILITVVAVCMSIKQLNECLEGKKIPLITEDGMELMKAGYRDFLFLYLFCVPDIYLLDRMLEVLARDYGQMCTGISLNTSYRGTDYDITQRYALYD